MSITSYVCRRKQLLAQDDKKKAGAEKVTGGLELRLSERVGVESVGRAGLTYSPKTTQKSQVKQN